LDGATALKYVRERPMILKEILPRPSASSKLSRLPRIKFFPLEAMLDVAAMNDLFNALGETIQTDITLDEIGFFIELSKKLDTQISINMVLGCLEQGKLS